MSVQMTDADTPRPDEATAAGAAAAAGAQAATTPAATDAATATAPAGPVAATAGTPAAAATDAADAPAATTAADSGSGSSSAPAPAPASASSAAVTSSSSSSSSTATVGSGVPMSDSSSSSSSSDGGGASDPPAPAPAPVPTPASTPTLPDLLRAAVAAMRVGPPPASDATVAASVKQVAKLLTAVAARPGDKKLRQHRLDNIIIKKYIHSVPGAMALCGLLGFREVTLEGKPYMAVEESDPVIAQYAEAADVIVAAAAAPLAAAAAAAPAATSAASAAPEEVRPRCIKNCGFFGSQATGNMCSLCYAKSSGKGKATAAAAAAAAAPAAAPVAAVTTAQQRSQSAKRTPKERLRYAFVKTQALCRFNRCRRPVQVHRDRCFVCDRRLNLSGIECRCGYVFCGRHRYADEHDCRYDHQRRHQSALAKLNQKVQGSKLEKIADD